MPDKNPDTGKTLSDFRPNFESVTFETISEVFEQQFGHGWKRRLAQTLDVPESTVHSWLKAGKEPKWVSRLMRLMLERSFEDEAAYYRDQAIADFMRSYQVVESGDGYAVYKFEDGIGRLIAAQIADLDTATEIASLPRAKATIEASIEELNIFAETEIGKERAVGELVEQASGWCRRADIADTDWEPDLSKTIVDAFMDAIRHFGSGGPGFDATDTRGD